MHIIRKLVPSRTPIFLIYSLVALWFNYNNIRKRYALQEKVLHIVNFIQKRILATVRCRITTPMYNVKRLCTTHPYNVRVSTQMLSDKCALNLASSCVRTHSHHYVQKLINTDNFESKDEKYEATNSYQLLATCSILRRYL